MSSSDETRYDELRQQCIEFHKAHPQVLEMFERFTFNRINLGFKNYSAYAIFERIRWETDQAQVDKKKKFKLNNNYRPFYSRAFMKKHPQHDGFFRTRMQTSKGKDATGLPEMSPQDFS